MAWITSHLNSPTLFQPGTIAFADPLMRKAALRKWELWAGRGGAAASRQTSRGTRTFHNQPADGKPTRARRRSRPDRAADPRPDGSRGASRRRAGCQERPADGPASRRIGAVTSGRHRFSAFTVACGASPIQAKATQKARQNPAGQSPTTR